MIKQLIRRFLYWALKPTLVAGPVRPLNSVWTEPKSFWLGQSIGPEDFNRIQENILYLRAQLEKKEEA